MGDQSILPAQVKEQEERRKKALAELEALKTAVNSAPTDPNVAAILRWVAKSYGISHPLQVINQQGEVIVSSTVFNVGQLSVYQALRKFMSVETLNIVERSE